MTGATSLAATAAGHALPVVAQATPVTAQITAIEGSLLAFVVLTALATALARDVLAAVIVFGAYSLGMAALYTFYRAPDVALTEAAISAGVTTVLLLLTLAKTTRIDHDVAFESVNLPAVGAVGLLFGGFLLTMGDIPAVGSPDAPVWSNPEVSQWYLQESYAQTGVENTVMAVLAAFRGFDTFGEAVVVFAGGIAALIVLHREVFA
jgi:multicomponent Na+:H+ antiporter subunit B